MTKHLPLPESLPSASRRRAMAALATAQLRAGRNLGIGILGSSSVKKLVLNSGQMLYHPLSGLDVILACDSNLFHDGRSPAVNRCHSRHSAYGRT